MSVDDFWIKSSLVAVCPISSVNNGYPMHVPIFIEDEFGGFQGYACAEQVRTVDLESRRCKVIGQAEEESVNRLLSYIGAIFGI